MSTVIVGDYVAAERFAFYVLDMKTRKYMIVDPGVACKILDIKDRIWTLETPLGVGTIIRYTDWRKVKKDE